MKKGIDEFVSQCPIFQKVKVEHKIVAGLAESKKLKEWNWEITYMDFITGLQRFHRQHDSMWVIIDSMIR